MANIYIAYDRKPKIRQYGIRIKSKKRFIIFLIIALVLMTASFALMFNNTYASSDASAQEYVINYGDSLWSIAQDNKPDGIDTRDYVSKIINMNGLQNGIIKPGAVIQLP